MKAEIKLLLQTSFQMAYNHAENDIEQMKILAMATECGIPLKLKENYEVNFTNELLKDHFHV